MSDRAGATGAGSAKPAGAPEIPGYQVRHRLGAGAGGVVWSAVRDLDRSRVAIKVIDAAGGPAPTDGGHGDELAALRGVQHPHVVRLIEDFTLPDGRLALVLDEVRGGTLARVVRARGHLTPPETVTVLTALATTLADLHRLGVTHADLSPGNVLFHLDGRPMLADLGLSRV
ncbi:MAG: protein kinase, partial [Actinomycetota bacterium]|nr:protein kinase [Actinomycetota bacterium]